MRRVLGLENLVEPLPRSTVTIGKFFAVHRGHQALLQATVRTARERGVPSVVLTFDRHPLEVLRPAPAGAPEAPILASLEERLDLIELEGIDVSVVIHTTREFLALEPEAFIREILVRKLGAVAVLASSEFRFGRAARGDIGLLRAEGARLGFEVPPVPIIEVGGERVSSSRVADSIESGRVEDAAVLLGRPYSVPGEVVRGAQVGRKLGFPTANVAVPPRRLLPADGVYVTRVNWGGERHPAVANLGVRPTVDGTRRVLEPHLLDWDGDLYGREVRVEFLKRLRGEQLFPNLDALREQIGRDVEEARGYFQGPGG
jgi:riboflavin kinase/FMN adenylyltransferase